MAHWIGYIKGSHGPETRLGTVASGFEAYIASWSGRLTIHGYTSEDREDRVIVELEQHYNGAGMNPPVVLYEGPIAGTIEQRIVNALNELPEMEE